MTNTRNESGPVPSPLLPALKRSRLPVGSTATHRSAAEWREVHAAQVAKLQAVPAKRLIVLTCMDARIVPNQLFGLEAGDAHVLRNAGGRASPDAIRSILISLNLMDTREIIVMHHTDCGAAKADQEGLATAIKERSGYDPSGMDLLTIGDPDAALSEDVDRIASHPGVPKGTAVTGCRLHLDTGHLDVFATVVASGGE